jgi:hypothetical protein
VPNPSAIRIRVTLSQCHPPASPDRHHILGATLTEEGVEYCLYSSARAPTDAASNES